MSVSSVEPGWSSQKLYLLQTGDFIGHLGTAVVFPVSDEASY